MDCAACASCRLGVSSATGRLRWCVPEKDSSRRLRFVVTAVVLLLVLLAISTVIVVRLSGLCNAPNSTIPNSETTKSEEVEGNVLPITLRGIEIGELEKRRLPYMTTEFVPPLVQSSPVKKQQPVEASEGRYRRRRRRRRKRESPWDVVLTKQKIQEVIWPSPRPQGDNEPLDSSNFFQLPVQLTLPDKSSGSADYPYNPGDLLEELDWNPVSSRSRSSDSSRETPAPSIDTSDGNANSYVRFYPHFRELASDLRRYYSHQ